MTKTEGLGWGFEASHGNTKCEEPTVQYGVHIEDFTVGDMRSRCGQSVKCFSDYKLQNINECNPMTLSAYCLVLKLFPIIRIHAMIPTQHLLCKPIVHHYASFTTT